MPNITTNHTISYTNFAKVQRPLFNFSKACMPHQRPPEGQQVVSARQWVNPLKKITKKIRERQNHVQVDSKELFCVLGYETKRGSTVTRVPQFYRLPLIVKIRMPLALMLPFFSEKNPEIFCCFDTSFTRGTQRQFSENYLFGRRFEIQNFRNICCKISCLPASPRIYEHLKKGIIAHF